MRLFKIIFEISKIIYIKLYICFCLHLGSELGEGKRRQWMRLQMKVFPKKRGKLGKFYEQVF